MGNLITDALKSKEIRKRIENLEVQIRELKEDLLAAEHVEFEKALKALVSKWNLQTVDDLERIDDLLENDADPGQRETKIKSFLTKNEPKEKTPAPARPERQEEREPQHVVQEEERAPAQRKTQEPERRDAGEEVVEETVKETPSIQYEEPAVFQEEEEEILKEPIERSSSEEDDENYSSDFESLFEEINQDDDEEDERSEPTNEDIPTMFDESPIGEVREIPAAKKNSDDMDSTPDSFKENVFGRADPKNMIEKIEPEDLLNVVDVITVQHKSGNLSVYKKKPAIVQAETELVNAIAEAIKEGSIKKSEIDDKLFSEVEDDDSPSKAAGSTTDIIRDFFHEHGEEKSLEYFNKFDNFPFAIRCRAIVLAKADIAEALENS